MNINSLKAKEIYLYLIPTLLIDLMVQIAAFKFNAAVFHYWDPADLVMRKPKVVYFLIMGFIIAAVIAPPMLYKRGIKLRDIALNAFLQSLITLGIMAVSVKFLFTSFAGQMYLPNGICATVAVFIVNSILKEIIGTTKRHEHNKIFAVVVGSDENAISLYRSNGDSNQSDYKMLGVFADKAVPKDVNTLGKVSDIEDYLKNNKVHNLYCSISPAQYEETVNTIIRICDDYCVQFYYVPNMDGYMRRTMTFGKLGDITVVSLRDEPLSNPVNRFIKRSFDVVISGLFLITLFPIIWILVAIGTSISSPGPIFFRQKRTGYRGKPFTMYKFRSMRVNADADRLQATQDDPRKTKFGNFLRRTSIDELPQFINVFVGDMSIIGPRPHMEYHTEMYKSEIDKYMVRHMVKPGLTGWAQVNGFRGETKTVDQMEGRVRADIWYIENWSILIDIKIFFMTIAQIFKGDSQAY